MFSVKWNETLLFITYQFKMLYKIFLTYYSKMLVHLLIIFIFLDTEWKCNTRRWRYGPVRGPRRKLVWKLEWIPVPAAVHNACTHRHTHKHKKEAQYLEKASELLTACSNQSINDECQHFGNVIAAKLRNYDTLWCAIQNEIIGIFLSVTRGILWTSSSYSSPSN